MRLELNKLFGISRPLTFEESGLIEDFPGNSEFLVPTNSGEKVLLSFVDFPITIDDLDTQDIHCVVDSKWWLSGDSCVSDRVYALRIKFPEIKLNIDWETINSQDSNISDHACFDVNGEIQLQIPLLIPVLARFYDAYRHAKYDLDLGMFGFMDSQTIDDTRKMPVREFREDLCYRITDGPNEFNGVLVDFNKDRGFPRILKSFITQPGLFIWRCRFCHKSNF